MKNINNKAELAKMIRKYLSGKASREEEIFLESYYQHFEQRDDIADTFSKDQRLLLEKEMEDTIMERINLTEQPKIRRLRVAMKVAAAILVFLCAGIYFYRSSAPLPDMISQTELKTDINPGGNKALLTLADGSKISLDEARIGELARQGYALIRKTSDGQLSYDLSDVPENSSLTAFNTIETPRGGQYQVILPDGTKVWLNAASKLVFPTAFKGNKRRVELIGEGYFEVAKNKDMPFLVISDNQVIEVLGTHFNVSAYPDETAIKTTLLEGSVKVLKAGSDKFKLLKPGQQSLFKNDENILVSSVNANNAIDWKNGYFVFSNEDLKSVMRKISRWYDIDIEYRGDLTREGFIGTVSRSENISEVLSVLQLTGLVHFKLEGRRVIVMP